MSWIRMNDGWIRPSKAPNPLTASIFFLLDNDVLTLVGQYLDKLKMESSRESSSKLGRMYWGAIGARKTYFSENVMRQIRCLHPGFILYQSDNCIQGHHIDVEVSPLKKLPVVDRFRAQQEAEAAAGGGFGGPLEIELFAKKFENVYSPRGIDIVNRLFKEYKEHNDITSDHCGLDSNGMWWWEKPIWKKKSTDSKYIEGSQHIDKTLDERQKMFNDMFISGELDWVLYEGSLGNGGAILVQEWRNTIYF